MGYTRKVLATKNFFMYVKPYISEVPTAQHEEPLLLTVRVEEGEKCAHQWRNYFVTAGVKQNYRVSVKPWPGSPEFVGIQIEFRSSKPEDYIMGATRGRLSVGAVLKPNDASEFIRLQQAITREPTADDLKIAEAIKEEAQKLVGSPSDECTVPESKGKDPDVVSILDKTYSTSEETEPGSKPEG